MTRTLLAISLNAIFLIILLQGCPREEAEDTVSRSESGNIFVYEPDPGDTVSSPVTVTGRARVFEAALTVRVTDQAGRVLGQEHIMASEGGPAFGEYTAEVEFERPTGVNSGYVEALSFSAKDGSVINLVRIPVEFE